MEIGEAAKKTTAVNKTTYEQWSGSLTQNQLQPKLERIGLRWMRDAEEALRKFVK